MEMATIIAGFSGVYYTVYVDLEKTEPLHSRQGGGVV